MAGKDYLILTEDRFFYIQSDSLFIGSGKWYFSSKPKRLFLYGTISTQNDNEVVEEIKKPISLELRIKGKNKLISEDQVFVKIPPINID